MTSSRLPHRLIPRGTTHGPHKGPPGRSADWRAPAVPSRLALRAAARSRPRRSLDGWYSWTNSRRHRCEAREPRVSHTQVIPVVTLRHTLISPSSGKTVPKTSPHRTKLDILSCSAHVLGSARRRVGQQLTYSGNVHSSRAVTGPRDTGG